MAKSNGGIIGALNPTSFGKCTVTSRTSSTPLTTQPGTRIVSYAVVAGGGGGARACGSGDQRFAGGGGGAGGGMSGGGGLGGGGGSGGRSMSGGAGMLNPDPLAQLLR